MKILLSLFLFLYIIQYSTAQDAYKLYKMESIYLVGNKYIKNDVKYPIGFMGTNLQTEMQISNQSIATWNKYKEVRNYSMVASLAGLGLTIGALFANNDTNQRNLVIGGLSLSIISIPISFKANSLLQKSVWTRNRDLFQY